MAFNLRHIAFIHIASGCIHTWVPLPLPRMLTEKLERLQAHITKMIYSKWKPLSFYVCIFLFVLRMHLRQVPLPPRQGYWCPLKWHP